MSEADQTQRGPRVTVSLVTFNGLRWLPGCLASLERQTLTDFEVLALDNASTDGSVEWLSGQQAAHPWLSVEASDTNLGFAAAHNRNIFRARGEFVFLLNQDIELDEHFLEEAVAAFAGRPRVGAVQGKLLSLAQDGSRTMVLDSTGLVMHRSRRVISRGQGQADSRRYSVPGPVWGADGPAPLYRLSALMEAREPRTAGGEEILDEDFFMYKEDVDLAWRLRRLGWQTWYQPSAVAWHARTAAAGDATSMIDIARSNWKIAPWIKAMSWRNQRLMQIKNEEVGDLLLDLLSVAARELAADLFVLLFDPRRPAAAGSVRRHIATAFTKREYLSEAVTKNGLRQ